MAAGLAGILVAVTVIYGSADSASHDHLWTDASGNYQLTAEFIARNEQAVVLQLEDNSLLIVEIAQLSPEDQIYIDKVEKERDQAKKEAGESPLAFDSDLNRWELVNGQTIFGAVVEHGRRLIQLHKRGPVVYVNDRPLKNLPEFYQQMIPAVVNHFENTGTSDDRITNQEQLEKWLTKQPGRARSFTVEGVLMESYNGDLYGVPFFLFNESDLRSLKPGWDEWLDADHDAKHRAELALWLRARTMLRHKQEETAIRLQRLHVQLEAYNAGLFDLWKVELLPPGNQRGIPVQVIVPARNSAQAEQAALAKFPGLRVGAVAKVRRKW